LKKSLAGEYYLNKKALTEFYLLLAGFLNEKTNGSRGCRYQK
jgi:hypothetical protein